MSYMKVIWDTGRAGMLYDMVKYGAVSVIALVVDFSSMMLMHSLGINYLLATTLAFLFGLVTNYVISNRLVFKNPKINNSQILFIAFGLVGVIGLIINDFIIWFTHSELQLNLVLSKIIAVTIVFFWNFLARRNFLYHGDTES